MAVRLWKNVFVSIGLTLLFFGLVVSLVGFGHAMNAYWGTSAAFTGFAELLFGIVFLLLGNALITLGK